MSILCPAGAGAIQTSHYAVIAQHAKFTFSKHAMDDLASGGAMLAGRECAPLLTGTFGWLEISTFSFWFVLRSLRGCLFKHPITLAT